MAASFSLAFASMVKVASADDKAFEAPDYGKMPWGLFVSSLVVAAGCVAYPELHHLYRTVKCVVPGDRINAFEAQRGDGGCWAAFNVSMGDSWDAAGDGSGPIADCLGACGGCAKLSARTRWTVHCAEDAACAWYARTKLGRRPRTCGKTWKMYLQDLFVVGLLGKCQLETADYIRAFVNLPGDESLGPKPPQRVLHDHPCDLPLNHRWKIKRGRKETLYAFLHNQPAAFLGPHVAATAEALRPLTAPLGAAVRATFGGRSGPAFAPTAAPKPADDKKPRVLGDRPL